MHRVSKSNFSFFLVGGQPQAGGGGVAERDGGDGPSLRGHAGAKLEADSATERKR